jgi:hypothetical protein
MNRKEFTVIAVIIFLSVVAWIAFDIVSTRSKSSTTQKELHHVVPLTPTFNNDIIMKLKGREE